MQEALGLALNHIPAMLAWAVDRLFRDATSAIFVPKAAAAELCVTAMLGEVVDYNTLTVVVQTARFVRRLAQILA